MARSGNALSLPTPPASSGPSPEPPSPRRPSVSMFGETPPLEEETTTPGSEHLEPDAAAWGSPGPEQSDPLEQSAGRLTSSTGSSGRAVLDKAELRDTLRGFVTGAGELANEHLTRDRLEHDAGLYLADEDDAQGIGDPLASLAHRHGLTKVGDPDTRDAIMAAIALGKYLWKQWGRWQQVRALRQTARVAGAEAGSTPVGTDDPAGAAFGAQEG